MLAQEGTKVLVGCSSIKPAFIGVGAQILCLSRFDYNHIVPTPSESVATYEHTDKMEEMFIMNEDIALQELDKNKSEHETISEQEISETG